VCHDSDQVRPQPISDFRYQVLGDKHASALFAAVDFDQGFDVGGMHRDCVGGQRIVGDHGHAGTAGIQPGDVIEFRGCDPDRVQNVDDTMAGEILRLRQGRNGDPAGLADQRQPGYIDRLRGFHVGPERHAKPGEVPRHRADVSRQFLTVEDETGCRKIGQFHDQTSPKREIIRFPPSPRARQSIPRGHGDCNVASLLTITASFTAWHRAARGFAGWITPHRRRARMGESMSRYRRSAKPAAACAAM
jgi:hypothetical protein